MRTPRIFEAAERIGGFKLLESPDGKTLENNAGRLYLVRCENCGADHEVTRPALLHRTAHSRKHCRKCRPRTAPPVQIKPKRAVPITIPGWGLLQPLGPMGHRHDGHKTRHERRTNEAEES